MTAFDITSFTYLFLLVVLQTGHAYRLFQTKIPNGGSVMSPCNNQSVWEGVGHQNKEGGSERNPFGIDFNLHGKEWTVKLCMMDSDGDGWTNGAELGDPDCVWKPGAVPSGMAWAHPGVCEPLSSPECKARNSWLNCDVTSSRELGLCNHIEKDTTYSVDLRLDPTTVPASETTYFCQLFDLNVTSDDVHMVATQPLIAASEVVHHILLFGCDPRADLDAELRAPYRCVMVPDDGCRSLIGAWTVGSQGECAHPQMGFRIGPRGYRTVALQIHWNNPRLVSSLVDNSGLRIHLSRSMRTYDAGMLVVGQRFMQIDPVTEGVTEGGLEFSATCPERCTKVMFKTPIYITSAVNHMHYLGKSQQIKIYRNNTLVSVVTDQHNYNYDDPVIYNFQDAIEVRPGDELRTTCVYKRTVTSDPVCWGEATSDEMCFGFITYYPLQSLTHPWCTSMKSFPSCDRHLPALSGRPIDDCRWWEFRDPGHPETKERIEKVLDKCYRGKGMQLSCTDACRAVAKSVASHPCLQGDISSYMVDKYKSAGKTGSLFLDAVITCSCQKFQYCDRKTPKGILGSRQEEFCSSASPPQCQSILLISVFVYVVVYFRL